MARDHRLFLSYARDDSLVASSASRALDLLGYDVWIDHSLSGGQTWWNEILHQIRECHAFVILVSRSMLQSPACTAELQYAIQLHRSILPVMVEDVTVEVLPRQLATLQLVNFQDSDADSALSLARALGALSPSPPLPTPLPEPPPTPLSYLTDIAELCRTPGLSVDAQLSLVARLEQASTKPSDAPIVLELSNLLLARDDLYYSIAKRLEHLLAGMESTTPAQSDASGTPVSHLASDQARANWAAHLLSGTENTKTLEVSHGEDKWLVRVEFPPYLGTNKVFVNDKRQAVTETIHSIRKPALRFLFTLDAGRLGPVKCEMTVQGTTRIKGLSLAVAGQRVYSDGSLS
jgi:hypothetical protein